MLIYICILLLYLLILYIFKRRDHNFRKLNVIIWIVKALLKLSQNRIDLCDDPGAIIANIIKYLLLNKSIIIFELYFKFKCDRFHNCLTKSFNRTTVKYGIDTVSKLALEALIIMSEVVMYEFST